ncbi:DUF2683 family protein [Pedobacter sp. N23S346]|uniref:DUF2683 family protein n=1 Tax=Pedobacter sp. N23S346 TaxID=3402750 RepID=UPI003ACF4D8C
METFVIQTKISSQTKGVKDALEALHVKMKPFGNEHEVLPDHISKLLNKALTEADQKEFTLHEDFMEHIKSKYEK